MKSLLKKSWPIFIILLFVLIYFYPLLLGNLPYSVDFGYSDLTELHYPLKEILSRAIKTGEIPFWTDLFGSGYPILAEGQIGFFYPINLILYSALPTLWAFNLSYLIHLFLGGLFLFLFLRKIKLSQLAAIFGGLIFVFSSFFATRFKHVTIIEAAIWLPLIFYLAERYFEKKKYFYSVLIGLVLSLPLLAGQLQLTYYSALAVGFYFLFKSITSKENWQAKKDNLIKAILSLVLAGAVFLAVAAIQIIPSRELSNFSWRGGGLSFAEATAYPYHPRNFLTFLSPFYFGNPAVGSYPENNDYSQKYGIFWENTGYVGILGLIFAALGLVFGFKKKRVWFFGGLLVLSAALGLGKTSFIFKLFWQIVPGFSYFRMPSRFLFLMIFCLAILAALGFDFLIKKLKDSEKFEFSSLTLKVIAVFIIIFSFFDLFLFSRAYNNFNFKAADWLAEPASVKFLKQDKDLFRIYSYADFNSWWDVYDKARGWQNYSNLYLDHREILPADYNAIYNLSSIYGLSGLILKDYLDFNDGYYNNSFVLPQNRPLKYPQERVLGIRDYFPKILGLQNVKYVLSFFDLINKDLPPVKEIKLNDALPPLKIYQNKLFLPRFYLVPQAEVLTGKKDILERLAAADFLPAQAVILEKEIFLNQPLIQAKVEILNYQPMAISLETQTDGEGFLFLSQTFFPGWRAKIDGKPTEILKANLVYSAVKVPAGEHRVDLVFQPESFRTGKYITILALILAGGYLGIVGVRRFRK